ncbi:hypothetical protein SDC9_81417 [bioreactor metagenome]|uniref:Uncharacterized protein n=1 Tax=bioreactor metagenome TaxID=1076179 RepID=A0A644Z2K3_9ZZZZ
MVAGGDHHPGARGQPAQCLAEQRDRLDRRDGAVVHVTGDQHGVDPLGLDHLDQVVGERLVGGLQALAVQGPPQVPVSGVQDAHV